MVYTQQALKIPAGETCRVLGRLEKMEVKELVNYPMGTMASNPEHQGLQLIYPGGDVCDPMTHSTREVHINLVCNKQGDPGTGEFLDVKKEATYVHGCFRPSYACRSVSLVHMFGTSRYPSLGACRYSIVIYPENRCHPDPSALLVLPFRCIVQV